MNQKEIITELKAALQAVECDHLRSAKDKLKVIIDELIRTHDGWKPDLRGCNLWQNTELSLFTFSNEAEQFENYYATFSEAKAAFMEYKP